MAQLDRRNVYDNSQTFCKLVEIGSFSGVARKLNITQPTVTRRIAALEEELGIQLIQRSTRSFNITQQGQKYYDFFILQNNSFMHGIQNFQNQTREDSITIRLAIPMGICNRVLSPHIPEFLQKYPQLKLDIFYQNREVDFIRENFDIVILRHIPKHRTLKIRKLFETRFSLYCSPEYIERYGLPVVLEDLKQHLVIGILGDNNLPNKDIEVFDKITDSISNIAVTTRCFINNVDPALSMALEGHIIVGGRDFLYKEQLANGKLVRVLPNLEFSHAAFYVVRTNSFQHSIVDDLSQFLHKCFELIT